MADHETGEYHTTESGASSTYPLQCGCLKKGGHVVINGRPTKIIDYSTSKTGKHGHAKAHIIATDIFTGKKLEELCPTTHNMDVPNVVRTEYSLVDINEEGYVSLMDGRNEMKEDLKVPDDDIGKGMQKAFEAGKDLVVSAIAAMGEELIIAFKEASEKE